MRTWSLGWVRTLAKLKGNLLRLIVGPQSRVAAMAENAQPDRIRKEGRPAKVNSYNYKSFEQEGTSATYLTARIARDRPDILADMKAVIEIKFARQKSADITFFFVDIRSL